jgi:hypothetical protein
VGCHTEHGATGAAGAAALRLRARAGAASLGRLIGTFRQRLDKTTTMFTGTVLRLTHVIFSSTHRKAFDLQVRLVGLDLKKDVAFATASPSF